MRRTTSSSSVQVVPTPDVLVHNEDCGAVAFGNFLIVMWNGASVASRIGEVERAMEKLFAAYPGGLSMLLILRNPKAGLDARSSEQALAIMKRAGPKLIAFCCVGPGDADRLASLPAETRAMLVGASQGPSRFFERLDEGTDWLESYLEGAKKLLPLGARLGKLVDQAIALYPPRPAM